MLLDVLQVSKLTYTTCNVHIHRAHCKLSMSARCMSYFILMTGYHFQKNLTIQRLGPHNWFEESREESEWCLLFLEKMRHKTLNMSGYTDVLIFWVLTPFTLQIDISNAYKILYLQYLEYETEGWPCRLRLQIIPKHPSLPTRSHGLSTNKAVIKFSLP